MSLNTVLITGSPCPRGPVLAANAVGLAGALASERDVPPDKTGSALSAALLMMLGLGG